jgi:hypothetical protein
VARAIGLEKAGLPMDGAVPLENRVRVLDRDGALPVPRGPLARVGSLIPAVGEVGHRGPLARLASLRAPSLRAPSHTAVGEDGGDGEATYGLLARAANPRVPSPRVAREVGEGPGMDGAATALAGVVLPLESQASLV